MDEKKYELPNLSEYVGYTIGKRKTDDSPTFAGPEVVQTATLSKARAEENIRALEVRYQCNLSAKTIKADKIKAANIQATIKRLQLKLQMAYIRDREYASKAPLYEHVTSMRLVAQVLLSFIVSISFVNRSRKTSTQPCARPKKAKAMLSWPQSSLATPKKPTFELVRMRASMALSKI